MEKEAGGLPHKQGHRLWSNDGKDMEHRSLGKGNRKTPGMVRSREGLCPPVCRCAQGRPQCKAQWRRYTQERERKLGDAWKKSIPDKRIRSKTKSPTGIRRKHRTVRVGS